jgi:hypothetical protein
MTSAESIPLADCSIILVYRQWRGCRVKDKAGTKQIYSLVVIMPSLRSLAVAIKHREPYRNLSPYVIYIAREVRKPKMFTAFVLWS